jgi:hypothetical protein
MKAKKALKRLNRVEALLTEVLDQYTAGEKDVRAALDSAKTSIASAWESVNRAVAAKPKSRVKAKAKAKPVKSQNARQPKRAAKAKRKPVVAAKRKFASKSATAALESRNVPPVELSVAAAEG